MSAVPFTTHAEIAARHPRELAVLAADETTRVVDPARVEAACADVTSEIRAILRARYSAEDFGRLDAESLGVLRLYAIDMVLFRLALSFGRQSETIEKRYATAVKRLEGIAAGKGALTLDGSGNAGGAGDAPSTVGSPNEVVIDAPERLFTRRRFRGTA